jgi:hypothetical protein
MDCISKYEYKADQPNETNKHQVAGRLVAGTPEISP